MYNKLKETPFFMSFQDEQLKRLEAVIQEQRFSKGDVIFSEGDIGDAFYIIFAGQVSICVNSVDEKKRLKTIAVREEGDLFGEMSLFKENEVRSATVIAENNCTIFRMSKEDFLRLLDIDNILAKDLLSVIVGVLSNRLREMDHHFITIYETGKIIGAAKTIEEIGYAILRRLLSSISGTEGGIFLLWNRFNEEYDILSSIGYQEIAPGSRPSALAEEKITAMRIDANDPLLKRLAEEKRVLRINDFNKEDLSLAETALLARDTYGCKSLLASPMVDDELNVLGFIILTNWSKRAVFKMDDQILLETVVDQIVPAIKISLYKKNNEYQKDLEERKFWQQMQ